MDRMYYQLIDECNDLVRLSIGVVRSADYKPCIKEALDPFIIDAIKESQRMKRLLEELLNKGEYANVMSMRP
jgi:hypothetical protein